MNSKHSKKGFLIRREKNGIINAFSVEDLSEPLSDGPVVKLNREKTENQRTFELPDAIDFKPKVNNEPEVNVTEPEVSQRPGDELKAVLDPKRVSTTSTVYESIPDCDLEDPHLHIITEESSVPEFQKSEDNPDEPIRNEDSNEPEVDDQANEDVSDSTIDPLSTIEEEQNSFLTNPEDNLKQQKPEEIDLEGEKKPEEVEEKKDDDDEGFFAKMKKHFARRSSSSSSSSSASSKSSRSTSPSRVSKTSKPSSPPQREEKVPEINEEPETKKYDERIDFNRIYINRNHKSHSKWNIKIVSSCCENVICINGKR